MSEDKPRRPLFQIKIPPGYFDMPKEERVAYLRGAIRASREPEQEPPEPQAEEPEEEG